MSGGRLAILVSVIALIALMAQVPVNLAARPPHIAAAQDGRVGTLAMRNTPENPPGTTPVGFDWTPWIVLGALAAAVAAIGVAFARAHRRRPPSPKTAPVDALPDDWPQL